MTSRNSFFNLMKEDMKQRLWSIILAFIVIILPMTIAIALQLTRYIGDSWDLQDAKETMAEFFSTQNPWFYIVVCVGALICAGCGFAYLFSKKKVDFFHSLPVRREVLFAVKYINGVLVYLVPNVALMLISLVLIGLSGYCSIMLVTTMLYNLIYHLIGYLVLYSVIILTIMFVGNIVMMFGVTAWILGIVVSYRFLFLGLKESFYDTVFYGNNFSFFNEIQSLRYLTPGLYYTYWMPQKVLEDAGSGHVFVLVEGLILALVYTALALLAYHLRPSERAGRPIAFERVGKVIRISLELLAGMFTSYIFYFLSDGVGGVCGWMIFGGVLGVVLSHMFLQSVYHSDVKKCFADKWSIVLCSVCAVAVTVGMYCDITKYDDYMPAKSKVESISFWNIDKETPIGCTDRSTFNVAISNLDVAYTLAEKSRDWNKAITSENKKSAFGALLDYKINSATEVHVKLCYNLKNGRKVYRDYTVSSEFVEHNFNQIYDLAEYKEAFWQPAHEMKPGDYDFFEIEKEEYSCTLGNSLTEAERVRFVQALENDYNRMTWEQKSKATPLANLKVYVRISRENGNYYETYYSTYYDYVIYEEYTETLQFLRSHGVELGSVRDWSKVETMTYYQYSHEDGEVDRYGDKMKEQGSSDGILVDREDWERLYSYCTWCDYRNNGYVWDKYSERTVTMKVITDDIGNFMYVQYFVSPDADLSFLYD